MFTKRRAPDKPQPASGRRGGVQVARPARDSGDDRKGRATPTRKQAEQARRERLKNPPNARQRSGGGRQPRAERTRSAARERDALRVGDEANYPLRDRGPVRRFCRDYVDSRRTLGEILIPLMVLVIALSFVHNATALQLSPLFTAAVVVLLALDLIRLRFGLRRELARRFPGEPITGTTGYTLMRAAQMRFLRLPKPRVKPHTKI